MLFFKEFNSRYKKATSFLFIWSITNVDWYNEFIQKFKKITLRIEYKKNNNNTKTPFSMQKHAQ